MSTTSHTAFAFSIRATPEAPRETTPTSRTSRSDGDAHRSCFNWRSLVFAACLAACCLSFATPGAVPAALSINEVFYDPAGTDAGFEWVELYNSGPWAETLEGAAIESGGESASNPWKQVWAGSEGEWVDSRGFFWIGGSYAGRSADSPGTLDLRNGSGAVRLLRGGLELNRVGWGNLEDADLFEGEPARTGPAGRSLARKEDGLDTGDNQADFEIALPTPGRSNHPPCDLAVRLLRSGRGLPIPEGTEAFLTGVLLENLGRSDLSPARVSLTVDGISVLPDPARTLPDIDSGSSVLIPWTVPLRSQVGLGQWTCRARLDGDTEPTDDADTLRLWVGPSPVRLLKLAPHPISGATEWLALQAAADPGRAPASSISLEGWSVKDLSGNKIRIESAAPVPPDGIRIVARDSTAMKATPGFAPGTLLAWSGTWPSLNDAAGPGEAADSVFLLDPHGVIADWAAYGSTGPGEVWIRLSGAEHGPTGWTVDPAASAPGVAVEGPKVADPEGDHWAPAALALGRDAGGAWFRLAARLFPGSWEVRVVNLEGREVWRFHGATVDRADCWIRWDGQSSGGTSPAGLYLVQARIRSQSGAEQVLRAPLVLDR